MIIIKFQGGLGNQMLQYVIYRILELKLPQQEIKADLKEYQTKEFHNGYELERVFGIKLKEASYSEIIKCGGNISKKKNNILWKIIRQISQNGYFLNRYILKKYLYEEEICKVFNEKKTKNYYIDGWWVQERYIDVAKEDIISKFKIKDKLDENNNLYLKQIQSSNSISIHIRRGDYVGTCFDIVPSEYYKKAIEYMNLRLADTVFFVFSDDLQYVEKNFSYLKNKVIVKGNEKQNSYKDMFLMSQCKHNIITNSTFSLWGTELNTNPNKIVIAPKLRKDKFILPYGDWIIL